MFLMFSRVFCRDTNPITVENENTGDSPVIPQVQGSSSETTEAQSSGGKRKRDPFESAGTAPPAKYQKFELEYQEKLNFMGHAQRRRLEKKF